MSRRPPQIHTRPERQWRQLLREGGPGHTKTYVMEFDGGCLVQVLCVENGLPISTTVEFVPGASLKDFGDPME